MHDVALRAPSFLGASERPPILQRTDQDFLRNVLAALRTDEGRARLSESLVAEEDGKAKLYRPMHRTFHLALLDARCVTLGMPRLDGRKVESAGVVIRRVVDGVRQAWMQGEDGFRGWVPLAEAEKVADPDPERRRRPSSGNEFVDLHLVRRAGQVRGYREAHSRLFVAPPDACAAAGATVLYGLLPLGSGEATSAPLAAEFSDAEAREMLPGLLRAGKTQVLPSPGSTLRVSDLGREDSAFKQYVLALEQLLVQFDLRGTGARSERLRSLLASIEVGYANEQKGTALAHLERAIDVLVNRDDPENSGVEMPLSWPALNARKEDEFAEIVRQTLDARLASFAPRVGRFDKENAEYELWAFVRVRSDDGCPPRLYWSKPSQRFTLASWFESGPVAPPLIPLPEITRDNVKKLKPNVAFALPPSLFNFLRDNLPDKLMKGEGKPGSATPAIQWICGFNLSIIFMVAFILMFVFVILLNIVFFWLPFIKICIPIPASFKNKM